MISGVCILLFAMHAQPPQDVQIMGTIWVLIIVNVLANTYVSPTTTVMVGYISAVASIVMFASPLATLVHYH